MKPVLPGSRQQRRELESSNNLGMSREVSRRDKGYSRARLGSFRTQAHRLGKEAEELQPTFTVPLDFLPLPDTLSSPH